MNSGLLDRFCDLVLDLGANIQPGQVLSIGSEPGKEEVTRALAAAAYRRGAKFVDVSYFDLHVKRARIEHAAKDTLDYVPPWYGQRILALGDNRCARVGLTGPVAPGLLDDLDPELVGRDQLPFIPETGKVVNDRTTNWTAVPCPNEEWARLVHPSLDGEAALEELWRDIAHVCRLDEDDPTAAWNERLADLTDVAERLSAQRFDALALEGPGTDLTVGLFASSRWLAARFETVEGVVHVPNLPTEETFTTPDPERVDGVVRATKPLALPGRIVRGLEVEFEGGRAVRIDADEGAETVRALCARDEGAARLGEVALVDRAGRIGPLDRVFYDTLLDENAASHIAFGQAYTLALDERSDQERANGSGIHVDFMVGSEEVEVTGLTGAGERVPVLRGGDWQL